MRNASQPTPPLRAMSARRRAGVVLVAIALSGAIWGALRWRVDAQRQLTAMASGQWIAGARGAFRALVRDGRGGAAEGVAVSARLAGGGVPIELGSWTTGPQGEVEVAVELPAGVASGNYTLEVVMGAAGASAVAGDRVALPVHVERAVQVQVSTDKPEYRPGETVRWRALLRRLPDLVPLKDEPLACTLVGPDGVSHAGLAPATTAFGLADGGVVIPANGPTGTWRIRVARPDFALDLAERMLVVHTDARPDIELEAGIAGGRRYALAGETLVLAVRGRHAQGGPLAGGTVSLVRTEPALPDVGRPTVALSDDGTARLEVPMPTVLGAERLEVEFVLQVAWGDGRTERRALLIPVAQEGIQLALAPVGGAFRGDGVVHELALSTTTPDGAPIACAVEFRAGELIRRASTDALGLGIVGIDPRHAWKATATAGALTGTRALDAGQWERSTLVLRAIRSLVPAGEEAGFTLAGPDGAILVDLEANGLLCWTGRVELEGGRASFTVPVGIEAAGVAVARAYRLDQDVTTDAAYAPLVVVPAGSIAIASTYVRVSGEGDVGRPGSASFVPGTRVRCTVALADETGKPVAGAVWLSALDRALALRDGALSLMPQRSGGRRGPHGRALADQAPRPGGPPRTDALELALSSGATEPARTAALALLVGERWERAIGAAATLGATWSTRAREVAGRRRGIDSAAMPLVLGVLFAGIAWVALAVAARRTVLVHGCLGGATFALCALAVSQGIGGPLTLALGGGALVAQWAARARVARLGSMGAAGVMAAGAFAIAVGTAGALGGIRSDGSAPRAGAVVATGVGQARDAELRSGPAPSAPATKLPERLGKDGTPSSVERDVHGLPSEGKIGDESAAAHATGGRRARASFAEVAWWTPNLITDERGRATVEYTLPDDAAIWRARVGAVDAQGRLGASEQDLDARPAVVLELPVPEVLAMGDEVELVALAHRITDAAPERATVAVTAAGARVASGETASVALSRTAPGRAGFRLVAVAAGNATVRLVATDERGAVLDAVERAIEVTRSPEPPTGTGTISFDVRYPDRIAAGEPFAIALELGPFPGPAPSRLELMLALPAGVALLPGGVSAIGDGASVVDVTPRGGTLVISVEGASTDRKLALEVRVRARWAGRFTAQASVARDASDTTRWGLADAAQVEVGPRR